MKTLRLKNPHLERIDRLLKYELSSSSLFMISFFYGSAYYLLLAAVFLFLPYLMFVLHREEKYIWFYSLLVLVVIPALVVNIFGGGSQWNFVLNYTIIAIFFMHCVLLKWTVPQWMDSIDNY